MTTFAAVFQKQNIIQCRTRSPYFCCSSACFPMWSCWTEGEKLNYNTCTCAVTSHKHTLPNSIKPTHKHTHMRNGGKVVDLHLNQFFPVFLNLSQHGRRLRVLQSSARLFVVIHHLQHRRHSLSPRYMRWNIWTSKSKRLTWALMRATRKLFLLSSMDFSRRHSWAWPCSRRSRRRKSVNMGWCPFFFHVSGCLCVFGWVTYQHEVDVEVEYLVTHVHAEVVAEMVSQVGECSGRALEVCARHLHALQREKTDSGTVRGCLGALCHFGVSGQPPKNTRRHAVTFLQLATKVKIWSFLFHLPLK